MPDPTVAEAVAEKIAASSPEVFKRVVEIQVEKELKRRVSMIDEAHSKLDGLETQFNKIKPAPTAFDVQGQPIQVAFTPDKFNERKKLEKQINKLRSAINKALAGDFQELESLNKGGQQKQDNQEEQ